MPFTAHPPKSIPVARPRRSRRWRTLWLTAGGLLALLLLGPLFYAGENWRGHRAWAACQRVLQAQGVDFNWHVLAPPPVADRDNFATTPFLAALFDYLPGTRTPRDLAAYNRSAGFAQTGAPYDEWRDDGLAPAMFAGRRIDLAAGLQLFRPTNLRANPSTETNADHGDRAATALAVLAALAKFNPVLDELRAASRRPESRFNFSYDETDSWRMSQPHLPVLKHVCHVLTLRASAELALQNAPAAADDVALIFKLADSIHDEPFRSSLLARFAMLADARQIIWEGLADRRWSDAQLTDFTSHLQEISPLGDLRKPLRVEQAARNELFDELHRRPAIVKDWQFGPGFWNHVLPYYLWLMPSGWMYQEQVSYQRAFEEQLAPALDPESTRVRPSSVNLARHGGSPWWNHRVLSNALLGSAEWLLTQAAFAQTVNNQTFLACALERYRQANGQFPETLEKLTPLYLSDLPADLTADQSLKYHRTDDGQFQLYSIGWNGKDDGGKVAMNPDGKTIDTTQGDWVWPPYLQ